MFFPTMAGMFDVHIFQPWQECRALATKLLRWLRPGGHLFFRESCFHASGDFPRGVGGKNRAVGFFENAVKHHLCVWRIFCLLSLLFGFG